MFGTSIKTPFSGSLPIQIYPSPRGCQSEEEVEIHPLISVDLNSPRRHSSPPTYQSCGRSADSPDTPRAVVEETESTTGTGCCQDLCHMADKVCRCIKGCFDGCSKT